jgi:hypothetical protein
MTVQGYNGSDLKEMVATNEESLVNPLRIAMAHELGFSDYPDSSLADPYLNYIENRYTGDGSLDDYLTIFIQVIQHFQNTQTPPGTPTQTQQPPAPHPNTIHAFIGTLCASNSEALFAHTDQESALRKELVTDTVLYILGVWVGMLSYFVKLPGGLRQVELAYSIKQRIAATDGNEGVLTNTLPNLLKGSGLLPSPEDGLQLPSSSSNDFENAIQTILSLLPSGNSMENSGSSSDLARQKLKAALGTCITSSAASHNYSTTPYPESPKAPLLHTRIDSLESLSIKRSTLNAYTLSSLGGVQIYWTLNLSRHLLLSRFAGQHVLEVFALPCVLAGGAKSLKAAGIPAPLMHEIQESYCILFNPTGTLSSHRRLFGDVLGLRWCCWCFSCSALRLRARQLKALKRKTVATATKRNRVSTRDTDRGAKSEYDPLLEELMTNPDPEDWSYELFPHLWPRIVALEEHLVGAKPWSIWVLFRDRRDTLQFWTFL